MYPILERLRIVEASAFVAAPTGGLTLAQQCASTRATAGTLCNG